MPLDSPRNPKQAEQLKKAVIMTLKYANRFAVHPGWPLLIFDMGLIASDVLKLAGLSPDLFARKDSWLSPAEYFRLWHGLEAAGGEQNVPILLGESISVEAFDPPIFASFCSPNFNVALARLAEYKRLIGPLKADVVTNDDETAVTLTCYGYDQPLPRSLGAAEMVFLTQLARLATRSRLVPISCQLVTLPLRHEECETFLGCRIRLGSTNTIRFAAKDALRPFLTENLAMWQFFEPGLQARLSKLDIDATIEERVRSVLLHMLPSGQASVEEVAQTLAISTRSLQRRLEQENLNFRSLLSGIRRELACYYLVHSQLPPGEIAYLLGFEDPNSFLRAFKLWTGDTPGGFRTKQMRNARRKDIRAEGTT